MRSEFTVQHIGAPPRLEDYALHEAMALEEVTAMRGGTNEEQMVVRGQMREQHELVLPEVFAGLVTNMADSQPRFKGEEQSAMCPRGVSAPQTTGAHEVGVRGFQLYEDC